jgi:hypothetical protein
MQSDRSAAYVMMILGVSYSEQSSCPYGQQSEVVPNQKGTQVSDDKKG